MSTVGLPVELAPMLRERVLALLAQVPIAEPWWISRSAPRPRAHNRCVVCHEGGKLGGHHGHDGQVEWIHKSCHRRLHRRETHSS